jgi:hypothetical protein
MVDVLVTSFGSYTCFDCLLASGNVIDKFLYFRVSNLIATLSDCHCKLSWEMLASFPKISNQDSVELLQKAPINFIWDHHSAMKY